MKKGKAIEDNQLDNVQGGYVLKIGQGPNASFAVIDQSGNFLSIDYASEGLAKYVAGENKQSDQVITEEEYKKIFGHYPYPPVSLGSLSEDRYKYRHG